MTASHVEKDVCDAGMNLAAVCAAEYVSTGVVQAEPTTQVSIMTEVVDSKIVKMDAKSSGNNVIFSLDFCSFCSSIIMLYSVLVSFLCERHCP